MEISNYSWHSYYLLDDIINILENFCIAFNQYVLIYFTIFKYLFVFLLIGCGVLTLLKARRIYFRSRAFSSAKDENKTDKLTKPRLIVGTAYIVIGSGILFNYLTYFLIWILDPLPDRLIYSFIDLIDVDPYAINRITDISSAIYPHEKTIYYVFSMFLFGHTVHLTLSIWYLQFEIKNPRKTIIHLFTAVSCLGSQLLCHLCFNIFRKGLALIIRFIYPSCILLFCIQLINQFQSQEFRFIVI